jgi:hypothetical protein
MFNGRVHLPTRNLLYCSLPNKGARPVATDANGETEIDLEFLRSSKFWLFFLQIDFFVASLILLPNHRF